MGYNFFNVTPVRESFNKRLDQFLFSLGAAIREGKSIDFADNDINYTLDFQHKRIAENVTRMHYDPSL